MYSFLGCLAMLIIGFLVYGKLVDTIFKPTDEPTPAVRINDGVDYIPLPTWKVFMIQLLNIAGLGPIFGALGAKRLSLDCIRNYLCRRCARLHVRYDFSP